MSYKIKVPPRPIERDDVVALHWLDRWTAWETRHRSVLIPTVLVVTLAVALGGGGFGWWWWQNAQATTLAAQAAEHYPSLSRPGTPPEVAEPTAAERCAKALPLYQKISSDYSRSRLAPLALYYQGNCQVEQGHADQAIALYKQAIADYSPENDAVIFSAIRLGALYAGQNNRAAAIEQLAWVTQQAGATHRDQAYYELGRLQEADGKKEEALKAYTTVGKEFAKSPWATESNARITQLGGTPVLPEPPAPPAGETPAASPPAAGTPAEPPAPAKP